MFNITKQVHKLKSIACFLQIFFTALHYGTKYNICVASEFITKHEINNLESGCINLGNLEQGESVAKRLQSHVFT